ncbi:hypothetical protein C5S35_01405 [Candidatus Methanophagaceae archaeon]|nr:hypothetical protein C5S35_01405 [Methanophagales archaeon]
MGKKKNGKKSLEKSAEEWRDDMNTQTEGGEKNEK